ncbi:MAG: hypothetical protein OIN88_10980 [Candidatus Methanoperedens sp.]|nr:hypothetical protein [Candidatus Methanoperedens sp.]MCZ7360919.1 hypothetical protein [Candidatus Methanoperedens sp.]HLB70637.1 hypothetical protein [Candidatus Methanoperedens sp.]
MRRIYHRFPPEPEFEQKYNFRADLHYIVRTIAKMDGKFGNFVTDSPDLKGKRIQAKRDIKIEITDKGVEFYPLNKDSVDSVLADIEKEGTVDFRVALKYSFLNEKYERVPFKGDSFLVRAKVENGVLTMTVHRIEGLGRTEPSRIAETIVDEIRRNAPDV